MKFRLSNGVLLDQATLELKRVGFEVRPPRDGAANTLRVKPDDPVTALKAERILLFLDPAAKRV